MKLVRRWVRVIWLTSFAVSGAFSLVFWEQLVESHLARLEQRLCVPKGRSRSRRPSAAPARRAKGPRRGAAAPLTASAGPERGRGFLLGPLGERARGRCLISAASDSAYRSGVISGTMR